MKGRKHAVEFTEIDGGVLCASFSSKDMELMKRAISFICRSFPECAESEVSAAGDTVLIMRDSEEALSAIHAYKSGKLAVSFDRRINRFIVADFTGADVSLQLKRDRLEVYIDRRKTIPTFFTWDFPIRIQEDFERIASSFREEFSK